MTLEPARAPEKCESSRVPADPAITLPERIRAWLATLSS